MMMNKLIFVKVLSSILPLTVVCWLIRPFAARSIRKVYARVNNKLDIHALREEILKVYIAGPAKVQNARITPVVEGEFKLIVSNCVFYNKLPHICKLFCKEDKKYFDKVLKGGKIKLNKNLDTVIAANGIGPCEMIFSEE